MICEKCSNSMMLDIENNNIYAVCINCKFKKIVLKGSTKPVNPINNAYGSLNLNKVGTYIIINNIKRYRLELKVAQSDVAKCAGIFPQQYGNIERSNNIPTILSLTPISIALKIPINKLYTIETITEEQYDLLKNYIVIEEEDEKFEVKEDKRIKELRNAISRFKEKYNITDERIFKATRFKEPDDVVMHKEKLKEMQLELNKYLSHVTVLLKQERVIDYFHWQQVKKIIDFK